MENEPWESASAPRQGVSSRITHEHESAVEPSIALKYEDQKRVKFFQKAS